MQGDNLDLDQIGMPLRVEEKRKKKERVDEGVWTVHETDRALGRAVWGECVVGGMSVACEAYGSGAAVDGAARC